MAGASEMTTLTRPIIRPRACDGTSVMIVVMSSGIMIAVPDACTTRATTSSGNPGESERDERAEREEAHRGDVDLARREPAQQEAADRDDDRHRQHERGREPLGLERRDAEVVDEVRDRDAHRGLVEDRDEGCTQEQPDDPVLFAAGHGWRASCGRSSIPCRW